MSTPGTLTDPARTDPTAPGYRPGRTLPLRVEAVRQLRRRRTQVMAAILALLPVVMVAAFAIGGGPEPRRRGPPVETPT
ncbi:ABC transporter permease, partial [Streptomyces albidoflavus]